MQTRINRLGSCFVALLSLASMQGCVSSSEDAEESGVDAVTEGADAALRDVLLVGNSVAGTVSFLDAHTFENLGSMNAIPDRDEVLRSININPITAIAYSIVKRGQLIHHFEPSGGDRFVDDLFVSPDGTRLYASRSNLGDVAAFDLTRPEHPLLWRSHVDGFKADHATISPDGTRLVVSATSSNVANVFDAATGAKVGTFKTGTYPHQNDYSADGKHIYNSSIGNVSGLMPYALNVFKGDRRLIKVDAQSLNVLQTWNFDYGIRPSVITPDETVMYAQLSYLNGVIKFDLTRGVEVARSTQPLSAFAMATYATYDEFPHDSAHHGLALSGDGQKLCDCGTIDNTVSILSTSDLRVRKLIDVGMVPYWATTSPDGRYCYVSLSGDDAISVIDYESEAEVKVVPVGKFPQRSRIGKVPESVIRLLTPTSG